MIIKIVLNLINNIKIKQIYKDLKLIKVDNLEINMVI
jgi:hypothetical protein